MPTARRPVTASPVMRLFLSLAILFSFAAAAVSSELPEEATADEQTETVEVQEEPPVIPKRKYSQAEFMGGYRFVSVRGSRAGVGTYSPLRSGATGGLLAGSLDSGSKLWVDAAFLNEDDYHAELFYDYKGIARLKLEASALWHETDRNSLTPGPIPVSESDTGILTYGVRTMMEDMRSTFKLGNMTAHLNLGYRRIAREGTGQIRYADAGYFPAPGDSLNSRSTRIDGTTHEGIIGIDANLGILNMDYQFRITDYLNNTQAPTDTFDARPGRNLGGVQPFYDTPESRVTAHRLQASSNLSGGMTASSSYSLAFRESTSSGTAVPASTPKDTLQKVAGDITWTAREDMTFSLRYRRLQVDRDAPSPLYSRYTDSVSGRAAPDTENDSIILSGAWRPSERMFLNLEYQIMRDSRHQGLDWNGPVDSEYMSHGGKATLHWRPYKGIRGLFSYAYENRGKQDFASLAAESHKGNFFLTYARSGLWGITLSYHARGETGETPVQKINTSRSSFYQQGTLGFWLSPLDRLVLSGNYSHIRHDSDQEILFHSASPLSLTPTSYRSNAHMWSMEASYAATERLDFSAAYQEIRSDSGFFPAYNAFSVSGTPFDTEDLTAPSRTDTTDRSVTGRVSWYFMRQLGCSLDYLYRDFSAGTPTLDGTLHTGTVSLKARW